LGVVALVQVLTQQLLLANLWFPGSEHCEPPTVRIFRSLSHQVDLKRTQHSSN